MIIILIYYICIATLIQVLLEWRFCSSICLPCRELRVESGNGEALSTMWRVAMEKLCLPCGEWQWRSFVYHVESGNGEALSTM